DKIGAINGMNYILTRNGKEKVNNEKLYPAFNKISEKIKTAGGFVFRLYSGDELGIVLPAYSKWMVQNVFGQIMRELQGLDMYISAGGVRVNEVGIQADRDYHALFGRMYRLANYKLDLAKDYMGNKVVLDEVIEPVHNDDEGVIVFRNQRDGKKVKEVLSREYESFKERFVPGVFYPDQVEKEYGILKFSPFRYFVTKNMESDNQPFIMLRISPVFRNKGRIENYVKGKSSAEQQDLISLFYPDYVRFKGVNGGFGLKGGDDIIASMVYAVINNLPAAWRNQAVITHIPPEEVMLLVPVREGVIRQELLQQAAVMVDGINKTIEELSVVEVKLEANIVFSEDFSIADKLFNALDLLKVSDRAAEHAITGVFKSKVKVYTLEKAEAIFEDARKYEVHKAEISRKIWDEYKMNLCVREYFEEIEVLGMIDGRPVIANWYSQVEASNPEGSVNAFSLLVESASPVLEEEQGILKSHEIVLPEKGQELSNNYSTYMEINDLKERIEEDVLVNRENSLMCNYFKIIERSDYAKRATLESNGFSDGFLDGGCGSSQLTRRLIEIELQKLMIIGRLMSFYISFVLSRGQIRNPTINANPEIRKTISLTSLKFSKKPLTHAATTVSLNMSNNALDVMSLRLLWINLFINLTYHVSEILSMQNFINQFITYAVKKNAQYSGFMIQSLKNNYCLPIYILNRLSTIDYRLLTNVVAGGLLLVASPIEVVASGVTFNRQQPKREFGRMSEIKGGVVWLKGWNYLTSTRDMRVSWVLTLSLISAMSVFIVRISSSIIAILPFILVRSCFIPDTFKFIIVMPSLFRATIPFVESNLSFTLSNFSPNSLNWLSSLSISIPTWVGVNGEVLGFSGVFLGLVFLVFITRYMLNCRSDYVKNKVKAVEEDILAKLNALLISEVAGGLLLVASPIEVGASGATLITREEGRWTKDVIRPSSIVFRPSFKNGGVVCIPEQLQGYQLGYVSLILLCQLAMVLSSRQRAILTTAFTIFLLTSRRELFENKFNGILKQSEEKQLSLFAMLLRGRQAVCPSTGLRGLVFHEGKMGDGRWEMGDKNDLSSAICHLQSERRGFVAREISSPVKENEEAIKGSEEPKILMHKSNCGGTLGRVVRMIEGIISSSPSYSRMTTYRNVVGASLSMQASGFTVDLKEDFRGFIRQQAKEENFVADLGCGVGAVAIDIANILDEEGVSGKVFAFDKIDCRTEKYKRQLAPEVKGWLENSRYFVPHKKVSFVSGDIEQIDWQGPSFDRIYAITPLSYLNDPLGTLCRWVNNLRPDGGVLIANFILPQKAAISDCRFYTEFMDSFPEGITVDWGVTYDEKDNGYIGLFITRDITQDIELNAYVVNVKNRRYITDNDTGDYVYIKQVTYERKEDGENLVIIRQSSPVNCDYILPKAIFNIKQYLDYIYNEIRRALDGIEDGQKGDIEKIYTEIFTRYGQILLSFEEKNLAVNTRKSMVSKVYIDWFLWSDTFPSALMGLLEKNNQLIERIGPFVKFSRDSLEMLTYYLALRSYAFCYEGDSRISISLDEISAAADDLMIDVTKRMRGISSELNFMDVARVFLTIKFSLIINMFSSVKAQLGPLTEPSKDLLKIIAVARSVGDIFLPEDEQGLKSSPVTLDTKYYIGYRVHPIAPAQGAGEREPDSRQRYQGDSKEEKPNGGQQKFSVALSPEEATIEGIIRQRLMVDGEVTLSSPVDVEGSGKKSYFTKEDKAFIEHLSERAPEVKKYLTQIRRKLTQLIKRKDTIGYVNPLAIHAGVLIVNIKEYLGKFKNNVDVMVTEMEALRTPFSRILKGTQRILPNDLRNKLMGLYNLSDMIVPDLDESWIDADKIQKILDRDEDDLLVLAEAAVSFIIATFVNGIKVRDPVVTVNINGKIIEFDLEKDETLNPENYEGVNALGNTDGRVIMVNSKKPVVGSPVISRVKGQESRVNEQSSSAVRDKVKKEKPITAEQLFWESVDSHGLPMDISIIMEEAHLSLSDIVAVLEDFNKDGQILLSIKNCEVYLSEPLSSPIFSVAAACLLAAFLGGYKIPVLVIINFWILARHFLKEEDIFRVCNVFIKLMSITYRNDSFEIEIFKWTPKESDSKSNSSSVVSRDVFYVRGPPLKIGDRRKETVDSQGNPQIFQSYSSPVVIRVKGQRSRVKEESALSFQSFRVYSSPVAEMMILGGIFIVSLIGLISL
ncbi:MAG: class I SAM-dependent methyltransferase, partial [Candidatus Omnitrophica bacterium]|nr:class I SAM-dependent methyltransferase [Candidatus Omnitrophota bacterium]